MYQSKHIISPHLKNLPEALQVTRSSFFLLSTPEAARPTSGITGNLVLCSLIPETLTLLMIPQWDIYARVSPRVITLDAPLLWLTLSLHSGISSGATFVRDFLSLVPPHCHSSSQGLALFFSWQHWWSKLSHRFIRLHVYYSCLPVQRMSMIAGGSLLSSSLSFHLLKW